jgi:hypothetical protein
MPVNWATEILRRMSRMKKNMNGGNERDNSEFIPETMWPIENPQ